MVAQRGKDLLLKIETDTGSFETVAGLRSKNISLNAESVDVTDSESAGRWRELLAGTGLRRAGVSGAGIFKDKTSDEIVRAKFFDSEITNWQIIVPAFGSMNGLFQITSLEYSGQHNGELLFEITLESAGEITFTMET